MTSRGGPDVADPSQAFGSYVLIESSVPIDMFAFLLRLVFASLVFACAAWLSAISVLVWSVAGLFWWPHPFVPSKRRHWHLSAWAWRYWVRSSFHLFSRGLYPNKLLYRSTVLKYTYIDDMKDHAMSETPNMESMHHIRAWTYCKKYIYYRCKIYAVFSEINISFGHSSKNVTLDFMYQRNVGSDCSDHWYKLRVEATKGAIRFLAGSVKFQVTAFWNSNIAKEVTESIQRGFGEHVLWQVASWLAILDQASLRPSHAVTLRNFVSETQWCDKRWICLTTSDSVSCTWAWFGLEDGFRVLGRVWRIESS